MGSARVRLPRWVRRRRGLATNPARPATCAPTGTRADDAQQDRPMCFMMAACTIPGRRRDAALRAAYQPLIAKPGFRGRAALDETRALC